ncbi:type II toxin-antitoxin system VapC family toxin [Rathayibacter soli]|uniref:type II toxin-antitoxin system VapC family toxin n=1 Tax=Rathayibacter soli TaxID=3144168 RepID=UPI0027E47628|nr:type II toxin-antitoxin system VapC family toxin [Glaciibacter superstes]
MPTGASDTTKRETVVVDASVVVTVLADPGAQGDAIAARLDGADLIAPSLLPYEVANVLRRRRNGGHLSSAEAALAFDGLAELAVELWPWEVLANRVWQLGENLSSYDGAYVALAEQTAAVLVTRDRHIARAPGILCRIEVF